LVGGSTVRESAPIRVSASETSFIAARVALPVHVAVPVPHRSYTTVEVATRLGVSLQTVQRWVDAGHLNAWKTPGGHRRIDAASADRMFDEQQQRLGTPPAQTASKAALAVVVVDDNPLDRALLAMLVSQALPQARVEAAADGFQGLVVIGQVAPQIVITDVHMPHMDGLAMIRSLLEHDARPRSVMVVSALGRQELAARGPLPPGVACFAKPVDGPALIEALRAAG